MVSVIVTRSAFTVCVETETFFEAQTDDDFDSAGFGQPACLI
jgi:hypothetical protein